MHDRALSFGLPSTIPDFLDVMPGVNGATTEPNAETYSEAVRNFKEHFRIPLLDEDCEKRIEYAYQRSLQGLESAIRFDLDLDELRVGNQVLALGLLEQPVTYLRAANEALRTSILEMFSTKRDELDAIKLRVGVKGSFGSHSVSARGLTSRFLSKMVSLEGIVTKMGSVRPKLVKSVHYVPKTKSRVVREYRDATSLDGLPTTAVVPTSDQDGNAMELEFGDSEYVNHQKLTIQEMPERAPLGQLPRSVEVICEDDLVDRVKPGDRIQCAGIYRALATGQVQEISGTFRTVIVCNCIQPLSRDNEEPVMTSEDVANVMHESTKKDVFERISRSLAPSIYGHKYLKKAVLLLMLGGEERVLENGAHLRGDINVLIVGDPSTAKSQMLRFVLNIAPLAISTTGRGSTGVGLTAAVTTDPDSGERRLEAGAMVLADRGVVLIDEFDKMGDADRVAIHEVMEQQTITIAKAGIHASLNARCSVVAAANPIYGSYDKLLSPQKNIGLPDSLLSRFDLLFVVLDNVTPEDDRRVADHVLRMHRYQQPGQEGKPIPLSSVGVGGSTAHSQRGWTKRQGKYDDESTDDEGNNSGNDQPETSQVFVTRSHHHHTGAMEEASVSQPRFKEEFYTTEFIRKYIHFAKIRTHPKLTAEAVSIIAEQYEELRQDQLTTKTLPITPRCLETLIRLATAHAKCRLSPQVTKVDCDVAIEVLRFALYNDTEMAEKRRKEEEKKSKAALEATKELSRDVASDDTDEDDDSDDKPRKSQATKISSLSVSGKAKKQRQQRKNTTMFDTSSGDDDDDDDDSNSDSEDRLIKKSKTTLKREQEDAGDAKGKEASQTIDSVQHSRRPILDENLRLAFFIKATAQVLQKLDDIHVLDLIVGVNRVLATALTRNEFDDPTNWPDYDQTESERLLQLMEENNAVMYRDNMVYKI